MANSTINPVTVFGQPGYALPFTAVKPRVSSHSAEEILAVLRKASPYVEKVFKVLGVLDASTPFDAERAKQWTEGRLPELKAPVVTSPLELTHLLYYTQRIRPHYPKCSEVLQILFDITFGDRSKKWMSENIKSYLKSFYNIGPDNIYVLNAIDETVGEKPLSPKKRKEAALMQQEAKRLCGKEGFPLLSQRPHLELEYGVGIYVEEQYRCYREGKESLTAEELLTLHDPSKPNM